MKKFPWLKMQKRTDPELPFEPTIWMKDESNGEYYHHQTERQKKLRQFVLETGDRFEVHFVGTVREPQGSGVRPGAREEGVL